jgi:hypothetical protein
MPIRKKCFSNERLADRCRQNYPKISFNVWQCKNLLGIRNQIKLIFETNFHWQFEATAGIPKTVNFISEKMLPKQLKNIFECSICLY